jgi:hypothetical protein
MLPLLEDVSPTGIANPPDCDRSQAGYLRSARSKEEPFLWQSGPGQREIYGEQKIINYTNRRERVRLPLERSSLGAGFWALDRNHRGSAIGSRLRLKQHDEFGDKTNIFCLGNFSKRRAKTGDLHNVFGHFTASNN